MAGIRFAGSSVASLFLIDRLLAHAAIQFVSAIPFQLAQVVALVPLFLSSRKTPAGLLLRGLLSCTAVPAGTPRASLPVSLCRFRQPFLGVLVASLFQISESQEVGGVGEGWFRNCLIQIGDCALMVLFFRVQPAEVVADAGSLAHLATNRFQSVARFGEAAQLEKDSRQWKSRASPVSDRLSMQRESFLR